MTVTLENPLANQYERHRSRVGQSQNAKTSAGTDIGPPPPVKDPERRAQAEGDLEFFLRTYFAKAFHLEFSDDQKASCVAMTDAIDNGETYAEAQPRGDGKTTRAVRSALWAILTGRKRFVGIIGNTSPAARRAIKALRKILLTNQMLYEDFPQEIHGFPQLGDSNRRAGGQHIDGVKTQINVATTEVTFPTRPGSKASGSIVYSCGLTGDIRGPNVTNADGEVLRPDLIILDDPQSKESATSKSQTQTRWETIEQDIMGLAGPDVALTIIALCTVIATDDLSERLLNSENWKTRRTKLLYKFPGNLKLWDEFFQLWREGWRVDKSPDRANAFYQANWDAMHEGAVVGNPYRFRPKKGELDGLQYAMLRWFRNPVAFAAEYQNEPIDASMSVDQPRCISVETKLTKLERGVVPLWATRLTAGIDIQQRLLYFSVIAWGDDFRGSIIDYGSFPEQPRSYFTLSDASPTLQVASGFTEVEASIWWGLEQLSTYLARDWKIEGAGGAMRCERALLDVGWGEMADMAYEFLRRTPHKFLMPSKGAGITAGKKPMGEWSAKPGEQHGLNWVISSTDNQQRMRRVTHDTNWWKTFFAGRCAAPFGAAGSLSIFGEREEQHRLMVDHLAAEAPTKTFGNGREVWEWHMKPGADNHLLDCDIMASVAVSTLGVSLSNVPSTPTPKLRTFSLPGAARA